MFYKNGGRRVKRNKLQYSGLFCGKRGEISSGRIYTLMRVPRERKRHAPREETAHVKPIRAISQTHWVFAVVCSYNFPIVSAAYSVRARRALTLQMMACDFSN